MGERQAQVLQAAIELLDEVGLDGLTMRVLASRLGVRAGALYRHYPSKQALLDAMVAHLATPPAGPPAPDRPWDERLRDVAMGMREVRLAHLDGARLMSTFHHPGGDAVAGFHGLVGVLVTAGLPADGALVAVDTVVAYVNGYTIEEQAREDVAGARSREQRDRAFGDGLELIISGVRGSLRDQPGPAGSGRGA
ncbi:TetR/AcrR family transcriptional regulator C-terminal domain-containing protein [Planotetraspora kaengkrachanensis]|uniref:TetR family transcriptional regulator n=1 Tax=Planotetraspora kaengkrachanensis TaxID=575193 RepID=A0A8J3LTF4_9ACTN|nr:TetR/AcrR family transcriptional regulator C-terminal domain-containing protein [Planotetraspora kaengkrachanensis]GIG78788.1 TetR family transcriptional regulator [Planotetraspora kaengkrachanensis]